MNVAGRSRPGEATERKSQRQGPGCIKPCFEIIVTSSLNLKLFFQPDKGSQPGGGWGEETRSGTQKRCSHNLQSGHPAFWSADN